MLIAEFFSLCSEEPPLLPPDAGLSSQFFLLASLPFPTSAETFVIPAAILAIFFLPEESTAGDALSPPESHRAGDNGILLATIGLACRLPAVGDGCRYLDGTIIAGGGESGEDADVLEERAAVVAGDFGVGIHRLEELEEDSGG